MRRISILFLILSAFVPILAYATAAEFISTPLFYDANLVSYWRLEDVNDSKGTNTLTNNNVVTFTAGKFNNAATFASASSQSLTRTNAIVSSGAFSVVGWVKFTTTPATNQHMAIFTQTNTGNYSHFLMLSNLSGTLNLYGYMVNGANSDVNQTAWTPTTGVWYQVAQVYTGTHHITYLNGAVEKDDTYSGGYATPAQFNIGISGDASNWYLNGQVDDVEVFSRALTAEEMQQIFDLMNSFGFKIEKLPTDIDYLFQK